MKSVAYILFLVLITLASCKKDPLSGSQVSTECEDTNCADYSSRLEAQSDYNWNPECRADLDADNDGLACEENHWTDYYNSISSNSGSTTGSGGSNGCPTTANCGCSGLNKTPCENNICCKWVVGTGCKCN